MPVTVLDDLSSGKRSNLPDNHGITLVQGDIADAALVDRLVAEASVVYHLAAIAAVQVCEHEPERANRTNVIGTDTIFEAAARHGKPVVYASSAAVYGDNPALPLSEESATGPLGNYGKQKLANEVSAARFASRGLKSVGLRFFNVYGTRQDPSSPYSGVISKFMKNAASGLPLTFFGDGEQTRDFVYVGDIVKALLNGAEFARGTPLSPNMAPTGADVFNVCTGTATSLKQLAYTIGSALELSTVDMQHAEARSGDIRHSLGNPTKIMTAFQVRHWTPLLQGLSTMTGEVQHAA